MRAQRILLYGVTGSGKTTLARDLGAALALPSISADDEIGWLPGWRPRPLEQQRELALALAGREAWVMDTAYSGWMDVVLPRVQLIVALDYSRAVSLTRLLRRSLARAIDQRPVCNGNIESFSQLFSADSIVAWHFRSFKRKRQRIHAWAADPPVPRIVVLRSAAQARGFLAAARDMRQAWPTIR